MKTTEENAKKEVFKQVPGFKNYEVSNLGRIKSKERFMMWNNEPKKLPEKIMKVSKSSGYKVITLSNEGNKKRFTVHELVMLTFVGPRPNKNDINHINCNKLDNRLKNLEYCTRSENVKHAHENGLYPKKQNKRITFGIK